MNFSQSEFFNRLEGELSTPLIPWLQELLDISYMAARRLVIGETELKAVHLLAITNAFPEAVEQTTTLLKSTEMRILFRRSFSNVSEFGDYLRTIIQLMTKVKEHDNAKLYYCARDMPLFAFLKERNMLTFKVRLWCRELRREGMKPLPEPIYRLADELIELYKEIPSEEIWDQEAIAVQRRQILHFHNKNVITKDEYDILTEELRRTTLWLNIYAKNQYKAEGVEYRLWTAAYLSLNNAAAFKYGTHCHTIYTTGNAKYFSTSNPEAFNEFRSDWKQHLEYAEKPDGLMEQSWVTDD